MYARLLFRSPPAALLIFAATLPCTAVGQVVEGPVDTTFVVADSSDISSLARTAQARFERRRRHFFPVTMSFGSGDCDERVGRFCTWYGEGEWYPVPEDERITELRGELVAVLDSLQGWLPGDGWLLGQRVWYRSEAGDWDAAVDVARTCGVVEVWWCKALEGFALHGSARYDSALAEFEIALSRMEPEQAGRWRSPRRAVDSKARSRLGDLDDESPDSAEAVLDRLWTMADPLWLVPGNDRLTEHYARWTVTRLRDGSRNPFQISWGRDLEELVVRHGWEMGWERSAGRGFSTGLDNIIGHKHPEGRDFMPPGSALDKPAEATPRELEADRRSPKSLYAPAYAPVLLPMEGQVAVFPRLGEAVVVSTHFLPEDTTFHSGHAHDLPWLEPGDQAGVPDRIGLFAMPAAGGGITGATKRGASDGAVLLHLDPGPYVISAESWSPEQRRAGRLRQGIEVPTALEDIATLSDILIVRPTPVEPEILEEAIQAALPRASILPGQTFAIAWEVAGLGFRPETLSFEVSVERAGRNVLRRFGEFLRIADRPQPLTLTWQEPAPDRPTHHFRYLSLDLPDLTPGEYEIRLTLKTEGRSDTQTTKRFRVDQR